MWESHDLGPAVNGKYRIEITVWNSGERYNCGLLSCAPPLPGGSQPHVLHDDKAQPGRWREVWVVNGVGEPRDVTNFFDPATNKIAVTWAPVPEPDVSYVVQEKVGDGKWGGGGTVPGNATRYERVIEQPGRYQYRVAAVRAAPTSEGSDSTKRSDFVATSPVEIAQVTPPTTAGGNNADGSPDGGDPGVFMPTDPTSPPPGGAAPAKPRASSPPKGSKAAGRSVQVTGGRPVYPTTRPGSGVLGDAEGEGMEDDGYSAMLPYDQRGQPGELIDELAEGEGPESMIPGVTVPRPRDTRALLIPLAAGLALFVFAMQCTVVLRRRPAMNMAEDDFGDWIGY